MNSVVVLSPEELRALIRDAIREALSEDAAKAEQPITDDERATMRKRFRRMGRGA